MCSQIKLNGTRIELGEVECVLQELSEIQHVICVVQANPSGAKHLVAYVTPAHVDTQQVLQWGRRKLPQHMVPTIIMALAELPVLPNGKIDWRSLPPPNWGGNGEQLPSKLPLCAFTDGVTQVVPLGIYNLRRADGC